MSIFKDASQTLLKYGELLVNKTEEYTKIAKLNLDIKKLEGSIDKMISTAGQYIVEKLDNKESFTQDDSSLNETHKEIVALREDVATIKKDIDILKHEAKEKQQQAKSKYAEKKEEAAAEKKPTAPENSTSETVKEEPAQEEPKVQAEDSSSDKADL